MTDETNDLPIEGGTDNVEISDSDDLEFSDQTDPDDEQDDGVALEDDGTDDEEGEVDEPSTDEEAAEPEPAQASEIADDVLVKMPDGTSVSFGDLKESPMLKADHTRKTQELATERKTVTQQAQDIEGITGALVDFLANALPEEPPLALSATDPNKYTRMKATFDAAQAQMQKLIETGRNAGAVRGQMSIEDRQREQQAENTALLNAFPELSDTTKRTQFLADATEAAKAVGYSDDEVKDVYDSKTIQLAYWAKKGLDADKAKAKAKVKVAKAPPVTPKRPSQGAAGKGNADALRRLRSDDSIDNAVAALMKS